MVNVSENKGLVLLLKWKFEWVDFIVNMVGV